MYVTGYLCSDQEFLTVFNWSLSSPSITCTEEDYGIVINALYAREIETLYLLIVSNLKFPELYSYIICVVGTLTVQQLL